MKRSLLLLLALALIFLGPFPTRVIGDEDEDGPNLQVPDDFPEKGKEDLLDGIKIYKDLKSSGQQDSGYKRPAERVRLAGKAEKKCEKGIKLLKKAAKAAPKSHLPPFYLCILYQFMSDFNGGTKSWVQKARAQGEKAMKNLDGFYEGALELADICMRLEKYEDALVAYGKSLKMSNGKLDEKYQYHWGRFNCLIMEKKYDEAKTAWAACKRTKSDIQKEMVESIDMLFKLIALGDKWAPYNHETKHYVIHTNISKSYAEEVGEQVEIAYKMYCKVFKRSQSGEKFHVHVFQSKQDFQAKTGAPQYAGGFFHGSLKHLYYPRTNDLAWTNNVLYHEGFHQFLDSVVSTVPIWFNEGHATFFGPSQYITDGKKKQMKLVVNKMRLTTIKRAMSGRQAPSLDDLLLSGGPEWRDPQKMGIYYASAWSFVYFCWMYENGKYAKILQKFLSGCKKGDGGLKLIKKAFGSTNISQVQGEWYSYVKGLN
ncbi:MAG: tetratricopeptide repeat protein [Planctomycetota bacterium]|jgi:tetratricopeptide (TPR) repeat protein